MQPRINIFMGSSENVNLIKKCMKNPNLDIIEARRLTHDVIDNNMTFYGALLRYIAGDCRYNMELSHYRILKEYDKKNYDNILKALSSVEALTYEINLFHGFEKGMKYNQHTWIPNTSYTFQILLSKTPSWNIATLFAQYSSLSSFFGFNQKYMFVKYPKGTKHLCVDFRINNNDDFEYLSGNETLTFEEKIYHFNLFPFPTFRTYYVFKATKTYA